VKTSAGDVNNNKDSEENDYESAGSDVIHLLTEEEANQFREPLVFYLIVRDDISWEHPEIMWQYLETNFDHNLSEKIRNLSDFPVLKCSVLQAPTLDPEVKYQILKNGKNVQFCMERCLYNLQEELLEVTGPLPYLWSDFLNLTSKPTKKSQQRKRFFWQIQRALCNIPFYECRTKISPSVKPLVEEKYEKRNENCLAQHS